MFNMSPGATERLKRLIKQAAALSRGSYPASRETITAIVKALDGDDFDLKYQADELCTLDDVQCHDREDRQCLT